MSHSRKEMVGIRSKLLGELFYLHPGTGYVEFVDKEGKYTTSYVKEEWEALKELTRENIIEVHESKKILSDKKSKEAANLVAVINKKGAHAGSEPTKGRKIEIESSKTLHAETVSKNEETITKKHVRSKQKSIPGLRD